MTEDDFHYQLWDVETGNAVGGYSTEDAAMAIVRKTYRKHGAQSVAALLLAHSDTDGNSDIIADGETLIHRVREHRDQVMALIAEVRRLRLVDWELLHEIEVEQGITPCTTVDEYRP